MTTVLRVDGILHIVPKTPDKKEWYCIQCSKPYEERNGFIGFEHVDPIWLTPEQYKNSEQFIVINEYCNAQMKIEIKYGKPQVVYYGFSKMDD